MKKVLLLFLYFCLSFALHAENLIKDFDCSKEPMSDEFAVLEGFGKGKLSHFIEKYSWNRCLKFEIVDFYTKNGKRSCNTAIRIGGNNKTYGFVCKPDTTYKFSFELKGTARRVMVPFCEWFKDGNGYSSRRKKRTSAHNIVPQTEWTTYNGTFKTSKDAKRAALLIQFWGDESRNDFREAKGQYVLIDKIKIEEVKANIVSAGKKTVDTSAFGKLAEVKAAAIGNAQNPAVLNNFRDLLENKPARYNSVVKIWHDSKNICFDLDFQGVKPKAEYSGQNGNNIWLDDMAELFFKSSNDKIIHFAVSAGGGKWSNAVSANNSWTSSVKTLANGWQAQIKIPLSLIGYSAPPKKGDFLNFNIGRQYAAPGKYPDKPDFTKGNRRGGIYMYDNSSWVFGYRKGFGILFFDSAEPFIKNNLAKITSPELVKLKSSIDTNNVSDAMAKLKFLQEQDRFLKLSKQKFIIAQIAPESDPVIPFLPSELNEPQEKFKVRSAVNEHAPLVLALANMTNKMEEYRVVLHSGYFCGEPQIERHYLRFDLKQDDGTLFPASKITVRRGVRGRDSDVEKAQERYDILAKVNEVSTIPVPPQESGLVWITFDCHDVKPGIYKGFVSVVPLSSNRFKNFKYTPDGPAINDTLTKEIPVELEVLPFALEDNAMPLNGYRTMFRQDHADFMRNYNYCMYMITPWHFHFKFDQDGKIIEEKLRSYLEPHIRLTSKNLRRFSDGVRHVMLAYGAYDIFRRVHCVKNKIQYNTPRYWKAWEEWCIAVDKIFARNGISRNDYTVEVVDEPFPDKFTAAELKKACEIMKKAVPGVHLTITSGSKYYVDALKDTVDSWIFSHFDIYNKEKGEKAAYFRTLKGKNWSVYCCVTDIRQNLYSYYRLQAWKSFDINSDYVSIYQFFAQNGGMDFRRMAKDGELAYETSSTLVPTVRLENLRIGIDDVRYMRLLEKHAKGNSETARKARAFLKKASRDVVVVAPHDRSLAAKMRNEAIKFILELKK